MSVFPETVAAALAGTKINCAVLVRFDFASETVRLWDGNGLFEALDGTVWQGLGALGDVAGIEQAVNGEAPQATFTLSMMDADILTTVRDEYVSEVHGRKVFVLLQFFETASERPLDNPYPVWCGRCLSPTFTIEAGGGRSVQIAAESLFSLRSRPNFAMYTDRDQQKRFPGDKGFEFVGALVSKTVTWPDY